MPCTSYVITWADQTHALSSHDQIRALTNAARAHAGELLALGPVHASSQQDARPIPPWVGIARFANQASAPAWFDRAADHLGATTLLAPALHGSVWSPKALELGSAVGLAVIGKEGVA